MSKINLTKTCNIATGKLDSNAVEEGGKYPFFTCAPEPLTINTYAFDEDAILLAGNNASGKFHCQRYKGKFNAYQRTYVITAKDGYSIDYIYYNLKISLQHLANISQGSQTKFLTMKILDSFMLEDISLDDQLNQINILAEIDKKILINEEVHLQLENIAKMVYDYWFLQFDFPDKHGKPYKSSGGKMVWNEILKREIPKGWEVEDIGSMVEASRGISYNSSTLKGKGVPMINLASFNVDGSYKLSGIKTYSGEYTQDKILKPYDLVMCNTQQTAIDYKKDIIGKTFLVPDIFEGDIVSSHHVTTIKVMVKNMKFYLSRLFNTPFFHKYISGFTNGTNILGLLFDGVEKYKVIVPSESLLEKFSTFISNIEKQKSLILRENQELTALRDFLLPLLMNGQVGFKKYKAGNNL